MDGVHPGPSGRGTAMDKEKAWCLELRAGVLLARA